MKNWILRASTAAFTAGLMASLLDCGGSNNMSANNSSAPQLTEQCGAGTYLNNNYQCVPMPTANSSATTPQKVITH